MLDNEFRALMELFMHSDPWPVDWGNSEVMLKTLATSEAERRGFGDWIEAYHVL